MLAAPVAIGRCPVPGDFLDGVISVGRPVTSIGQNEDTAGEGDLRT